MVFRQHFNINQRADRLATRGIQRLTQLIQGGDANRFYSRSPPQWWRNRPAPGRPAAARSPLSDSGNSVPKLPIPCSNLQVVDAAVGHIVEQYNVDLRPLLQRGHQLRVQHHERAVSDQRIDFGLRLGRLHAQRGIHFIAHAGVAVLYVMGVGCPVTPDALQISASCPPPPQSPHPPEAFH